MEDDVLAVHLSECPAHMFFEFFFFFFAFTGTDFLICALILATGFLVSALNVLNDPGMLFVVNVAEL